jgi:YihY family inner membrane protein
VSRVWQLVKDFYRKAAADNVTGLSGMVAYNLLASVIPLAFLALFIAAKVLDSPEVEASVLADMRRLFPSSGEATLVRVLDDLRTHATGLGLIALVAGVWIGASFWGALDTAFCRIYHMRCRTWWEQKRFALVMLAVVLLFLVATVAIPTIQSILVRGATSLPFGLDSVRTAVFAVTLGIGVVIVFGTLCVIFWAVPNERMPWLAIWPGAAAATAAITAIDYAFPVYLSNISTIARVGTTLVFLVIVLIWFYAHALIILAAAIVNAMRYELHETGELAIRDGPCPDSSSSAGLRTGP